MSMTKLTNDTPHDGQLQQQQRYGHVAPYTTRRSQVIAVLTPEALLIAYPGEGRTSVSTLTDIPEAQPGAHVTALLTLMERYSIHQLWIDPTWARQAGIPERVPVDGVPHPFVAGPWARASVTAPLGADGVNGTDGTDRTDGTEGAWGMSQPAEMLKPWLRFYRKGVPDSKRYIVLPHLERATQWHQAPDGETLLDALCLFRDALDGHCYMFSPGHTATELLRRVHNYERGGRYLDISASINVADYPAPMRQSNLVQQLGWIRPLTPKEESARYLHGYDKSGMFLAASASLDVGMGAPYLVTATDALPILFDKRRPGYWLARVVGGDYPDTLPHPCFTGNTAVTGAAVAENQAHWYTTPTLTLVSEYGAQIAVEAAYWYPEQHQPLEPWYKALRAARAQLQAAKGTLANTSAPALALDTLKAVYSQGVGRLDSHKLRDSAPGVNTDLYRPDWRHTLIATANANMYRNAVKVWKLTGRAPIACITDCWYYPSTEQDATRATPEGLRLGDALGQYKVKFSGSLAAAQPALALLAQGRRPVTALQAFIQALHPTSDTTTLEAEEAEVMEEAFADELEEE